MGDSFELMAPGLAPLYGYKSAGIAIRERDRIPQASVPGELSSARARRPGARAPPQSRKNPPPLTAVACLSPPTSGGR